MRLYWEVAVRGFRRFATYRAATFAGIFTNTAFGFLRAYVLIGLFASRDVVGGYDIDDALAYVFVGQGMLMTIYLWGWWEIAIAIRSGNIVTDLSRPLNLQFYWLAQDLGRALYHALFRGIPPFLVGLAFFRFGLPREPETWLFFTLSVVLAVCISFALRFLINLAAFWLIDYRGTGAIVIGVWTFLSGFAVPVAFFPSTLRTVANVLPFRAVFQTPVDVFLEQEAGFELLRAITLQAMWAIALLFAGRLLLAVATRRLVVQGG
jgi:ABC-2 type transport system permease protein